MEDKQKQSINWWKWAFLLLVILFLIKFVVLIILIQPKSINKPNNEELNISYEDIHLKTSIPKKDLETLINKYLNEENEDNKYSVSLEEQLTFQGLINVFSFDVPLKIVFNPLLMDNGNVQLRVVYLELASFSLPIDQVMNLLVKQLDFPFFVAFEADHQMLVINFNELKKETNIGIEVTKLNLDEDEIEAVLSFDNQILLKKINQNEGWSK